MTLDSHEFFLIMPEIFVLSMASLILVLDLFLSDAERNISYWLSQVTLLCAAVITLTVNTDQTELLFFGTFIADPMGTVLKVSIYVITALAFLYSRHYLVELASAGDLSSALVERAVLIDPEQRRRMLETRAAELAVELDRDVNEGKYHTGKGAVVQVLGVKP